MNPWIHLSRPAVATGLALAGALAAGAAAGQQEDVPARAIDPATLVAETMPRADRSLILDLATASNRAIAVGERGHILVSESRTEWRQIEGVPTRATLTSIATIGDLAWAVGHEGLILHSTDGGLSWVRQRVASHDPESDDPHNGVPLLDVLFVDAENGFAVGAYTLLLRTRDGGLNWDVVPLSGSSAGQGDGLDADEEEDDGSWILDADDTEILEETDPHLNGIARLDDGSLFIVAERGAAFRSRDGGDSWERVTLPYDGSMFGVIALGPQHLLAYGLRGNVLESIDGGDQWTSVETGTTLSLFGGTALPNGGAVLVGANGIVLHRAAAADPFRVLTYENADLETPVLATVQAQDQGMFIVAGDKGFGRFDAR